MNKKVCTIVSIVIALVLAAAIVVIILFATGVLDPKELAIGDNYNPEGEEIEAAKSSKVIIRDDERRNIFVGPHDSPFWFSYREQDGIRTYEIIDQEGKVREIQVNVSEETPVGLTQSFIVSKPTTGNAQTVRIRSLETGEQLSEFQIGINESLQMNDGVLIGDDWIVTRDMDSDKYVFYFNNPESGNYEKSTFELGETEEIVLMKDDLGMMVTHINPNTFKQYDYNLTGFESTKDPIDLYEEYVFDATTDDYVLIKNSLQDPNQMTLTLRKWENEDEIKFDRLIKSNEGYNFREQERYLLDSYIYVFNYADEVNFYTEGIDEINQTEDKYNFIQFYSLLDDGKEAFQIGKDKHLGYIISAAVSDDYALIQYAREISDGEIEYSIRLVEFKDGVVLEQAVGVILMMALVVTLGMKKREEIHRGGEILQEIC